MAVLSVAGLAVIVGIGVLVHRAAQNRPRRPIEARPVHLPHPGTGLRLEVPHRPAIEPPSELGRQEVHHHLHLHGLTPDQIGEIITRRGGWTPP